MSDFNKKTDDAMATLQMLEDAVAKSAGAYDDLRKRADDLYEDRIAQIAKANGGDVGRAHGLAVNDEIASRAYAVSQELAEKQEHAYEAGGQIARYVG